MIREKKFLTQDTIVVDSETGEIVTQTKRYAVKVNTEEFYATYIEAMSGWYQLKSAVDMKMLAQLCKHAQFNTGQVDLSPAARVEICEFLSISLQQMTNSLANLKKKKLITGGKGRFLINPSVFWKGTAEARAKLMENGTFNISIELS